MFKIIKSMFPVKLQAQETVFSGRVIFILTVNAEFSFPF